MGSNSRLLFSFEVGVVAGISALKVTITDNLLSTCFCMPADGARELAAELVAAAETAEKAAGEDTGGEDGGESERPS